MSTTFSFRRIGYAIIRDLTMLRGTIITGLAIAGIVLYLIYLLCLRGDQCLSSAEFSGGFGLLYVVLGVLFTFSIFREAQYQKSNHLYFTLPISPLERMVAVWVSTTILHTLILGLLATVVGQLAILSGAIFFNADFHLVPVVSAELVSSLKAYFLIQPIFLLGAISFKKNRIGKTVLTIALLFFAFIMFNFFLYGILNYQYDVFSGEGYGSEAYELAQDDFSIFGATTFGIVFGPLMLIAAYFKLVEKEV